MLNVLSFFFINYWIRCLVYYKREFRCSMFWAFSLSSSLFNSSKSIVGFDAQCFELFLYLHHCSIAPNPLSVSMLNVLSFFFITIKEVASLNPIFCFDAQCFELFLYDNVFAELKKTRKSFDAQCFELFLYFDLEDYNEAKRLCFDAQCFELFLYSLNCNLYRPIGECVSMLNVLSFFFISGVDCLALALS